MRIFTNKKEKDKLQEFKKYLNNCKNPNEAVQHAEKTIEDIMKIRGTEFTPKNINKGMSGIKYNLNQAEMII